MCIVGSSGCGKSTLLNIVGGLETASAGEVRVDGDLVVGPGPDRGMVFQGYSLFPWKSVSDNIAFGLESAGWAKARRAERVDELLGITGLAEYAGLRPDQLSGGMRQRVAIARALAPEPDLLLLDEPFGALDAQTKKAMHEFLLQVRGRTGATILMVTHDVFEAVYLSQRIYVLASGRAGWPRRSPCRSVITEDHACSATTASSICATRSRTSCTRPARPEPRRREELQATWSTVRMPWRACRSAIARLASARGRRLVIIPSRSRRPAFQRASSRGSPDGSRSCRAGSRSTSSRWR